MLPENEASRKVINDIWTGTPPSTDNSRPRGTKARWDIGPGDADLPDSEDEDASADVEDDTGGTGVLWDDPDFLTPSSIKLSQKTFTGIEWMRPPVSISCLFTPSPVGGRGIVFGRFVCFFLSFFVCFFLCFFVSNSARKRLDRFA